MYLGLDEADAEHVTQPKLRLLGASVSMVSNVCRASVGSTQHRESHLVRGILGGRCTPSDREAQVGEVT